MDIQSCPLCGNQNSSLFDRRVFRGETVTNHICTHCGLVYQSPRKSDEELAAFYEQEYRQLYQGSPEPSSKDLAIQAGRAEALLSFVEGKLPGVARHLDIGCSAGLLLQYFQKTYNCQPVGIEPGQAYREVARQQGLKVYPSLDELQACKEDNFDLISLAHVLEHIPDPVAYLGAIRENLFKGEGWLLVEVPNLYAHDSFETAHLTSFSPRTLYLTLQKAGFEVVAFQRHGMPRSRLIPLYLTVLSRPVVTGTPFHLHPERSVRLKRQLGLLHRRLLTRLMPGLAWIKY